MTILRHPSLPEVEPKVEEDDRDNRIWFGYRVIADRGMVIGFIAGPWKPTEVEAITAWNDWVRPLVELQAEVERRRDGMRHLEASRTELLGTVDAYMNAVERLTADLAAANAEVERLRADNERMMEAMVICSGICHRGYRKMAKEQTTPIDARLKSLTAELAAANEEVERYRKALDVIGGYVDRELRPAAPPSVREV